MDKENSEVKLTFLHPHGPARSFTYSTSPDILIVSSSDILSKVDPSTRTGRAYYITANEVKEASTKLKTEKKQKTTT